MRNAAELRAAATATGWFNGPLLNYVGDGYTVPWQTGFNIGPTFAGMAWIYKAYLDANYLEFSRLHDWLYCPYGPQLIGATQQEADLALREELGAVSFVDGEIVYAACSTFGAPWFGVSTVGYVQPSLKPSGYNMPLGSSMRSSNVADFKVVMVFQQTTVANNSAPSVGYTASQRTGGWSESFWVASTSLSALSVMLKGPRTDGSYPPILPARATCLPTQASILGVRVYESGVGRGEFLTFSYPGTFSKCDQPQNALLCSTTSPDSISVRRFSMRGMPDSQIVDGEFSPSSDFVTQLKTYFDSLTNTSYRGRLTSPVHQIFTITESGLVTLRVNSPYDAGALVTISNALTVGGLRRGGEFRISTVGPALSQFTIAGWPYGLCRDGKVTQPVYGFVTVTLGSTKAVRSTTHKIGRPFAGYRGRRSKRRVLSS